MLRSSERFQSAPRAEARGDYNGLVAGCGDRGFNPRPAPKRGAMRHAAFSCSFINCFNPRPAPKRGAMKMAGSFVVRPDVSIRAPRRSAGR